LRSEKNSKMEAQRRLYNMSSRTESSNLLNDTKVSGTLSRQQSGKSNSTIQNKYPSRTNERRKKELVNYFLH
jgi:hypothetical protein